MAFFPKLGRGGCIFGNSFRIWHNSSLQMAGALSLFACHEKILVAISLTLQTLPNLRL